MSEVLFENYELFVKEHADTIGTPQGMIRMLNDEGMYRAYKEQLTEGIPDNRRMVVQSVLDRQRMMILNEAANVAASTFANG